MKRLKAVICVLLPLLFCAVLSFTACDFVSYNKGLSAEEEEYRETLGQTKLQYIEQLENLSSQDKYYDSEMRIYVLCLAEGKNELNECEDLDKLKEIFDKNAEIIKTIKTIEDYEEEEKQRQKELQDAKTEYIEKLNAVSSAENYREAERKTFEFYIEKGTEAINGCTDISLPEKIYLSYKETIESIKTAKQYEIEEAAALEEFRTAQIAEVKNYKVMTDYREAERTELGKLISDYEAKIMAAEVKTEIDKFVRDFKIKVYAIKTDKELYDEELIKLKDELKLNLAGAYKLSDYRENEGIEIQNLIKSFNDSVAKVITKEEALSQYIIIKGKLDSVKTASALDAEDRNALIEELYSKLSKNIYDNFDETERVNYLNELESVYSAMCDRVSLEGIRQVYREFGQELGMTEVLKEDLIAYNDTVFYRDNEKNQVDKIKEKYVAQFTENLDNESAKALLQQAKDEINLIKTNDDLWNDSLSEFRATLKALYGDAILEEPRSLTDANDYSELADIIDYYAFYQLSGTEFVCDTFRVKLNFDHNDAWTELVNVYWYCELIRTAVGITSYFESNSDYLVFQLIPYNFASVTNSSKAVSKLISEVEFDSDKSQMTARGENFDDFAYYKYGRTINVWNSQQLWYALEHEYVPICAPDSPAELVMNRAKEILREIIMEGMSDEEKLFKIYTWLGETGRYDGAFQNCKDNLELSCQLRSYHVEGALLDSLGVCFSYAKTFLLLSRVEGLEVYYVFGSHEMDINNVAEGHGYNYVKLNDNWYICDPVRSFLVSPDWLMASYEYFLLPAITYHVNFFGTKTYVHKNIVELIINDAYVDWSIYQSFKVKNLSVFISDVIELKEKIANLMDGSATCFSIICTENAVDEVTDYIIDYSNDNQYLYHITKLKWADAYISEIFIIHL